VRDLTGLDPPHLGSAKRDDDIAFLHEPIRNDPRLHVPRLLVNPVAGLVMPA
jgi:hypothetical protein